MSELTKKPWTPARMEGEVKVMCNDCGGYLWSTDRYSSGRDGDYAIACPKRRNGECGYASR